MNTTDNVTADTIDPEVVTALMTQVRPLALTIMELDRLDDYRALARAKVELVEGFKITNAEEAAVAADQLVRLESLLKDREAERMAITKPADEFKSRVKAAYDDAGETLKRASGILRQTLGQWQQAERARAEAAARAEAERIERERVAAQEAAQRAEQALLDAETGASADAAIVALEQAQAKQDELAMTVVAPAAAQKLAGVGLRATYSLGNVDLAALVTECARRLALGDTSYLQYLVPNEKMLGAIIRVQKDATDIVGVTVSTGASTTVRKR